jgi:H/ACA ribonucleoprotein complex non-core subunit NAF1
VQKEEKRKEKTDEISLTMASTGLGALSSIMSDYGLEEEDDEEQVEDPTDDANRVVRQQLAELLRQVVQAQPGEVVQQEEEVKREEGEVQPGRVVLQELRPNQIFAAVPPFQIQTNSSAFIAAQESSSSSGSSEDDSSSSSSESDEEDVNKKEEDVNKKVEDVKKEEDEDGGKKERSNNRTDAAKNNRSHPNCKNSEDGAQLPRIDELAISVPECECVEMGDVYAIVDDQVVVKSQSESAAIDLDSVLFLDRGGRALGRVFDVFGPVARPFYSVRFNDGEHIKDSGISVGQKVFVAPRTEHTSFIFLGQLLKLKGTDASWKGDDEVPHKFADYSDDEDERKGKREATAKRKAAAADAAGGDHDGDSSKVQRPRQQQNHQQQQQKQSNPFFYRKQKQFNPRDYGPIRWNSQHTGFQQPPPPPPSHMHQPPPPPQSWQPTPPLMGSLMRAPNFMAPPPPRQQQLPNPFMQNQNLFSAPPRMAYSNNAFRYPPPPPPPGL